MGRRLIGVATLLWSGCSAEVPPTAEYSIYLTNLEPTRVGLNGSESFDLRHSRRLGAYLTSGSVRFDKRRLLTVEPGSEIRFRDVLCEAGRLRTAIGFPASVSTEESGTYTVEVTAESSGGEISSIFRHELESPDSELKLSWLEIEAALPYSTGDLVFRTTGSGPSKVNPESLPGWANPTVTGGGPEESRKKSDHRNVIVFLIDTLRADHLQPYGYDRGTSPNLQALAKECLVFEQAHAAASWTKASVASLFTSNYPSMHGAEDYLDRMSTAATTLAEVMGEAGYRTCAVGFNNWVFDPIFNVTQGFERVFEVIDQTREGGARADSVVAEAIDWIREKRDEPFFVYVQTVDPHGPYAPQPGYRERFAHGTYAGELTGRLKGPGTHLGRSREQVSDEDLQFLLDLYDAEIGFADEKLGELIGYLKNDGLWDETALIVTADHGEEFLDHGNWSHGGTLFQEQLHVPLLIKLPFSLGIAPQRIDEPLSLLDVAPTLCYIVGIAAQETPFLGQNLIPLATAPTLWKRRTILAEVNKGEYRAISLRRGDRKYIRTLKPKDYESLFDLGEDPREQRNLVATATMGELEGFRGLVQAHLNSIVNPGIVVEFLSDKPEVQVDLVVESENEQLDFNLLEVESGSDSFYEERKGEGSTRWHFRFELGTDDGRDGVLLRPAAGETVVLYLHGKKQHPQPQRILLGPDQTPSQANPLTISADDESLWVTDPLAWEPRPGTWCRIWHLRTETVELTEAEIQALQDLGYLGK